MLRSRSITTDERADIIISTSAQFEKVSTITKNMTSSKGPAKSRWILLHGRSGFVKKWVSALFAYFLDTPCSAALILQYARPSEATKRLAIAFMADTSGWFACNRMGTRFRNALGTTTWFSQTTQSLCTDRSCCLTSYAPWGTRSFGQLSTIHISPLIAGSLTTCTMLYPRR